MDSHKLIRMENWDSSTYTGDIVGGKAFNLYHLSQQGFQVPAWSVVPVAIYQLFTDSLKDRIELERSQINYQEPASIRIQSRLIQEIITGEKMGDTLNRQLLTEIEQFIEDHTFYAVRSSAVGEDAGGLSYAGQMDSFLFVQGAANILLAIKKCWGSLYSERALAYRHQAKAEGQTPAMAVIIQEMVFGDISGVTFTMNPLTKTYDEMLISATHGIGEGIVSGIFDTDEYVLSKGDKGRKIREKIASKDKQVVFDQEKKQGTVVVDVTGKKVDDPCLQQEDLQKINEICFSIEQSYGFPQDIEWTLKEGQLFILQSRPITTISQIHIDEELSYQTIWDNSNITESYSGVTSPLTFSFIGEAYYLVYLQFCQVLHVPKMLIQQNDHNLRNMLGLLDGRVYYNLKNWYRLIRLLPGYQFNRSAMEQMMGVKSSIQLEADLAPLSGFSKYFIELPRLLITGISIVLKFLFMKQFTKTFMNNVTVAYERYHKTNFDKISAHGLVQIWLYLQQKVMMNWKAPIINDLMVMVFYGLLKKLIQKWVDPADTSLQNDLLIGQGNVESTMPMKMLLAIASSIQTRPQIKLLFEEQSAAALCQYFMQPTHDAVNVDAITIKRKIIGYLDAYGYRAMNELKLEEATLKDNPEFLFAMLKNYVKTPRQNNVDYSHQQVCQQAEAKVKAALGHQKIGYIIPKQWVFDKVVDFAKRGVSFREYQRFARTKMFGLAREIFRALGAKFYAMGKIEKPEHVFYLTKDEIFSFIEGTANSTDLAGLVRVRLAEFTEYSQMPEPAGRIYTNGIVYKSPFESEQDEPIEDDGDPDTMRGVSCCPGIVEGKVKVILTPQDDMSLNGEILVAGRTDPGWVPLYPSATGLLIERGSILSHSAIVAREMGLPAVVGIQGVTKRLKTGDTVQIDGAKGTVKVLNRC